MTNGPSVLEKARAMTAEASRLRQGEQAEHDAARVSQRVARSHRGPAEAARVSSGPSAGCMP